MIRVERESDSGYILKGELLDFTNGLNVGMCPDRESNPYLFGV